MKRKQMAEPVTHQEVQQALHHFLKNGGLIQRLPAQEKQEQPMVGGDKYQNFESLANLIS